jgi:membrane associated rhomboid family serine protease
VHLLTSKHPCDLEEDAQTGNLIWRDYAQQISEPLADWIDYLMATSPWQRPPNASFVLNRLEEGLFPPPIAQPAPPTPRWLIILNVLIFCILLVTGGQWFQRQQNQWQVSPQKNSPAGMSSN